jgi:hypothetical protein
VRASGAWAESCFGCAVFHVKLEPYKDYFLDVLDMILLACIFTTAVGSLAFLSGSSSWVLYCWQVAIYLGAATSVSAFVMAAFHEIYGKAHRAKVKAMYMSSGGLSKVASWFQSAVLPPVPEELTPASTGKFKLKAAVMKVGSRGNMLFGSLLNSLHTHAVKYGFAPEVRATMSDRRAPSLCPLQSRAQPLPTLAFRSAADQPRENWHGEQRHIQRTALP